MTIPLDRQASVPFASKPDSLPFDIAHLSPAELETLALNVLTTLHEKRVPVAPDKFGAVSSSWNQSENNLWRIHLGMKNVRRLLPLAKKLTLESLGETIKTTRLSREKRLIAAVHRIVFDPRLSDTAEVWEGDLSVIRIGPEYAADIISDDEAMLLLGHELTHVALRTGRLNYLIERVSEVAQTTANLELGEVQKEELAADFIGAEVLKRYLALDPTGETNAARFSRAFEYEPPSQRLARAWQDFCASYNGDPLDGEHLSQDQTFRALPGLDPEMKALIPNDAISPRLCR